MSKPHTASAVPPPVDSENKDLEYVLPRLAFELDELAKKFASALVASNRVHQHPIEMALQLAATNAIFRCLDAKEAIALAIIRQGHS